jgi:hypothetical protein
MMETIQCGHEVPLPSNITLATDTHNIGLDEHSLSFNLTGLGGDANAVLPPCIAAAGKLYSILLLVADTNSLFIFNLESDTAMMLDGFTSVDSFELTTNEDYALLFSTGRHWVVVNKKVT